jgi:hypothetical protein
MKLFLLPFCFCLFFMASSVQRTDSGAIKISSGSQKVQVMCPDDLPLPTLSCDSISASKSKCGFSGFIDSSKLFLTKTWHHQETSTKGGSPCDICCVDCNESIGEQSVQQYDPDTCTINPCGGCSGGHTGTLLDTDCSTTNFQYDFVCPGGGDLICYQGCCRHLVLGGGCCDFPTSITDGDTIASNSYRFTSISINPTALGCDNSGIMETTLSDEYTNDLLTSNTEDDLPDYSGYFGCEDSEGNPVTDCDPDVPVPPCFEDGQACECSASYDLSDDESSLAIQEFKYKFVPAEEDIPLIDGKTLHWVERFIPELTEDIIFEGNPYSAGDPDPDPDHWIDNKRSFDWTAEEESPVFEVSHPDSNGEITIEDIFWC